MSNAANEKKSFLVALEVLAKDAKQANRIVNSAIENCALAVDMLNDADHVYTSDIEPHEALPWDEAALRLWPERLR